MSKTAIIGGTVVVLISILSCREKQAVVEQVHFTREDSLTDRYLILQDSLLHAWNLMINDDNHKLKVMHHLLHELSVGKQIQESKIAVLNHRLEQLQRIRFTQKTMANPDVVEEYDFASTSLVNELVILTQTAPNYEQNSLLQSLSATIRAADEETLVLRKNYDLVAAEYNDFLTTNRQVLRAIDANCSLELRPLFDNTTEPDSLTQRPG